MGQVYFNLPSFVAWQSEGNYYTPSVISNVELTQWLSALFGLAPNGTPLPLDTVGLTVVPALGITEPLAQLLLANGVQLYQDNGSSALPDSFSLDFLTIAPLSLQGDWDSSSAIFTPNLELVLSGQAIEYSVEFNFVGLSPSFSSPSYPFFNVSILPDRDGLYSNIQDQVALASYLSTLGTLSEQQIQAELASFVTGLADNIYAVSRVNAFNLLAAYGTDLNGTNSTVVLYNNLVVPPGSYTFSLDTNGYQLLQGSTVEEYGNTYLYVQDSTGNYITQEGSTIFSVTRDGQDISPTTYAGFSVVAAEKVGVVNQLLWTNGTAATAGTTAFVWSLTDSWSYSSESLQGIGYNTLGLETDFTYDLNKDGYIGQYYNAFETNGNAGLYIGGVAAPAGFQYFASELPGETNYFGITRSGQDITSTTYSAQGFFAVSAERVGGVNQLLWTNGTSNANGTAATAGTTAIVWSLNSEWAYLTETDQGIGYNTLGLETNFTYDLNNDGRIGQYYNQAENSGNTGLYLGGVAGPAGFQYFASALPGATTYFGITRSGQDITSVTYSGYTAVAAENVSGVNQLLWTTGGTFNPNGTIATAGTTAIVWSLTSSWDYATEINQQIGYNTLGLETNFTYDLNNDGRIGQYYNQTENSGNTGLYLGGVAGPAGFQYFASALPGATTYFGITRSGQDITSVTYSGYTAVAAENVSGVNQLLWTTGAFAYVWSLNASWSYVGEVSVQIGPSLQSQALEKTFYYDLDGLNGIADPVADGVTRTTVQSSVDVITGSIVDEFYIALAPTGSIAFTGGGGSDAYQLYTSAGVQFASTGGNDYMAITDFSLDDKIVLLGSQSDYSILDSGASLYYVSGGSSDLIATIAGSALNSSQLVYTTLL